MRDAAFAKEVNRVISRGKEVTFGGGLAATIWGSGFESGINYTPKYAQRGVTRARLAAESAQYVKLAKYTSRVGGILTGGDVVLSFGEYIYSDQSWGDKTKLGVNLGITALGQVRHPAAVGASIGLGIAETAGAFNSVYDYADYTQVSGNLVIPPGVLSITPVIFKIR